MKLSEWRENPRNAVELQELIESPIFKSAILVLEGLTAAKTIGTTPQLTSLSNNAHILFGFDAGRASILNDLNGLSIVPEEIDEIQPTYTGEF